MLTVLGYVAIVWLIASLILFFVELKKAPVIDERELFLRGDYDEKADPTKTYITVFCTHCKKNIDDKFCNNGIHLRKLGEEMVETCKKEEYFEPE
jgi:hypothetical protein